MHDLLIFTVIACLGMLVQAFAGFAGSLFAIPLFALFISPRLAVPAYNLVMIVVNLILVYEARKHINWKRILRMSVGGVVGIPFGAYCLANAPVQFIKLGISVMTLLFGLLFLMNVRFKIKETMPVQTICGLLSGFLGGAISESGPPVVLLGLSLEWKKEVFRATLLAYFAILSVTAIVSYYCLGLLNGHTVELSLVAVVPVVVVAMFGVVLKNKVPDVMFRKLILTIVIFVGLLGIVNSI